MDLPNSPLYRSLQSIYLSRYSQLFVLVKVLTHNPKTINPSLECACRFRRNPFCPSLTITMSPGRRTRTTFSFPTKRLIGVGRIGAGSTSCRRSSKIATTMVAKFHHPRKVDEGHICSHTTFQHLSARGRTNLAGELCFKVSTGVLQYHCECEPRMKLFDILIPEDISHNPNSPVEY